MRIQYKPKRDWLKTIIHLEILQGMALTLRKLFSRPITRQYPKEKPTFYPGWRGQHALVRDPQSGTSKCVACMRCSQVCPSRCIRIRYHQDEDHGPRIMDSFEIEALRCVYCGYCVEVCPVNAITMTDEFEYAAFDRESIFFDREKLLSNWDDFMRTSSYDQESYVNPFWRPRGIPESKLTAASRLPVPDDWLIENQFVGGKARTQTRSIVCAASHAQVLEDNNVE